MVGFVRVSPGLLVRAGRDNCNTCLVRHSGSLPRRAYASAPLRMASSASANVDEPKEEENLVQYVVVRRDLITDLQWPLGSVITQGVHAAVGAMWMNRSDETTMRYCGQPGGVETSSSEKQTEDLSKQMHTVVLEAKNEAALVKLSQTLDGAEIAYALWREHPENICTALASKPYPRAEIQQYFKKFRLFK